MPEIRSYATRPACPGVLRDERIHVACGPDKKSHDGHADDSRRHRGGDRLRRVPCKKHAIYEMEHRGRAGRENQRKCEPDYLAVAAGFSPPRTDPRYGSGHRQLGGVAGDIVNVSAIGPGNGHPRDLRVVYRGAADCSSRPISVETGGRVR